MLSVLNRFRLTVTEQLKFYGALKGIPSDQLNDEVHNVLENLGLTASNNKLAVHLSGTLRNKCVIAMK